MLTLTIDQRNRRRQLDYLARQLKQAIAVARRVNLNIY